MNEQQNTTLIKDLYAAFGRGDLQSILKSLADDVEWIVEGPSIIPFAGTRKGIPQTQKFFEALATTQDNPKLTIDVTVAQGDHVASFGRYSGSVKATGKKFDITLAHLFTIRNGKIARFVDVIDTAATVEAYTSAAAAGR